MLTSIANTRTRLTAGVLLAAVSLQACAHGDLEPATVAVFGADERDGGSTALRQVAVRVAPGGGVEWEGRAVTPEELQMLMQQAAMGSRDHLLVVVSAAGEVRYGDVIRVMQMARMYGIETKLADLLGGAEKIHEPTEHHSRCIGFCGDRACHAGRARPGATGDAGSTAGAG